MFRSFVPFGAAGAIAVAAGVASPAQAAFIISGNPSASTENTGANFTGTLDYTHNGGNSGTLVVSLTNSSASGVGGFLTAFVFNAGVSGSTSASLNSSSFAALTNASGANAQPYGNPFVGGAGTGGQFEGGGAPSGGIPVGGTGTFTFAITSTVAGSLTDASFITGPYAHNFVVRFRGLAVGAGSDKVPAVPTPGTAALAAMGLISLRRKR